MFAQQKPVPKAEPVQSTQGRTEILTFDNWTVTCQDQEKPAKKRACSGELRIIQKDANNNARVMFRWVMGMKDGKLLSVLQLPTGVLIQPGVEFKIGSTEARKSGFSLCDPAKCETVVAMDDAFVRDAIAASQTEATIYAADGRGLKFTINMKGFEKVLSELRK